MNQSENSEVETKNEAKRTLRKVRAQFIRRKPEEEEQQALICVPKPMSSSSIHTIDPAVGLMEKKRKIYVGVRYLNPMLKVNNIAIIDNLGLKTVTLNMDKPSPNMLIPWEYNVKRLESYGDLDLATWAHKVRTHYSNYFSQMKEYQKKLEMREPDMLERMEEMRLKIRQAQKDIESKYPFQKHVYRCDEHGKIFTSMTLSESILKEIDMNAEDFAVWAKENGIPALFEGSSKFHLGMARSYLDISIAKLQPVEELPEISNFIYDMNGCRKEVVMQYIRTTEPTEYGFEHTAYMIVKSSKPWENKPEKDVDDASELPDEQGKNKRFKRMTQNID